MSDYPLLPSQKNEVLEMIVKAALDPTEFVLKDLQSKIRQAKTPMPALVHREKPGFVFVFDWTFRDERVSVARPGHDSPEDQEKADDWLDTKAHLHSWLKTVKRELAEPDLWAEVRKLALPPANRPADLPPNDNAPFSDVEVKQIGVSLKALGERVNQNSEIPIPERSAILEQIDHLRTSADRIGRKDWKLMFIGALVGLLLTKAIEPTTLQYLWSQVLPAFGQATYLLSSGVP